jgi:phosphoglycerate dehydrogenase-like enzyme
MDRIRVGICYPPQLAAEQRERLERIDPRIEVFRLPYVEPTELRTAKRAGALDDALRARAPRLGRAERAALGGAEVLLALDVPEGLTGLAPRLRWLQTVGAGLGQYDEPALERAGVVLTNAAGVGAVPIAEFALGRLLQVWKGFDELGERQRARRWDRFPTRTLAGCTLGIVGLGAIGSALARRARAFEMRVIGLRRRYQPGERSPVADELCGPADLHRLLAASDAVVVAAPETPETRGLIDRAALAALKPGAVLCNVARGSLVDEPALIEALRSGRLRAAILDVASQEPLPADHPLWSAPNLWISPHCSASLDNYGELVLEFFAANLERYARGEPLHNVVDPSAGY